MGCLLNIQHREPWIPRSSRGMTKNGFFIVELNSRDALKEKLRFVVYYFISGVYGFFINIMYKYLY
ncbi:MAG: hypothetical protein AMJ43_03920 [Coxiella sp. DG_40]|nr:MAG: hypothetical protein AMJ43_03920 [Coxiella sp. DG_40]